MTNITHDVVLTVIVIVTRGGVGVSELCYLNTLSQDNVDILSSRSAFMFSPVFHPERLNF